MTLTIHAHTIKRWMELRSYVSVELGLLERLHFDRSRDFMEEGGVDVSPPMIPALKFSGLRSFPAVESESSVSLPLRAPSRTTTTPQRCVEHDLVEAER